MRKARTFVVTGAFLLAIGVAVAARSGWFVLQSVAVPGTVTAFVPQPVGHHAFTVRYEAGGQSYEILTGSYPGELSAGNTEFRVGQRLPVRYRPSNPAAGRIYELREQLGPAALFAVPGLGLLLYGLFPQGAAAGPLAGSSGRGRNRRPARR